MNRDFKGVWIPKEVWLSNELKMLEKVILTEIHSLDNENHCTAGNEYFAEFCSCSVSAVSKVIKHLKELGYIEELEFDGRHRKLRVVNFTKQNSKIYEAESQNLQSNNIDNKQTNNKKEKVVSKDTTTEFSFGKQKPKKENLYTKCLHMIDDKIDNADPINRKLLIDWLDMLLEKYKGRGKVLYANIFKGKLNMLDKYDKEDWAEIIQYNLQKGYEGFYSIPISSYSSGLKNESGARNVPTMTEEDYRKEAEHLAELEARGVQVRF